MTSEAQRVLVDLVREANPGETLPANWHELYETCGHNWTDQLAVDAQAALSDAGALVRLRTALGLPALV